MGRSVVLPDFSSSREIKVENYAARALARAISAHCPHVYCGKSRCRSNQYEVIRLLGAQVTFLVCARKRAWARVTETFIRYFSPAESSFVLLERFIYTWRFTRGDDLNLETNARNFFRRVEARKCFSENHATFSDPSSLVRFYSTSSVKFPQVWNIHSPFTFPTPFSTQVKLTYLVETYLQQRRETNIINILPSTVLYRALYTERKITKERVKS